MVMEENPSAPQESSHTRRLLVFCSEGSTKNDHVTYPHPGVCGFDGEERRIASSMLCVGMTVRRVYAT